MCIRDRSTLRFPSGPGVRVDSGVVEGETVSGSFDSMIAKLIVTGADRDQALARSRRALAELEIEGMATVVPFDRAIVSNPAFAPADGQPFAVHTRWIETEFVNHLEAFAGAPGSGSEAEERQTVVVEVSGKRLEVVLPATVLGSGKPAAAPAAKNRRERGRGAAKASGDDLTSPMQGTVVKLAVKNGAKVSEGDTVVVIEAMKMEQPLKAHKDGTVSGLDVSPGDTVSAGTTLATIR